MSEHTPSTSPPNPSMLFQVYHSYTDLKVHPHSVSPADKSWVRCSSVQCWDSSSITCMRCFSFTSASYSSQQLYIQYTYSIWLPTLTCWRLCPRPKVVLLAHDFIHLWIYSTGQSIRSLARGYKQCLCSFQSNSASRVLSAGGEKCIFVLTQNTFFVKTFRLNADF